MHPRINAVFIEIEIEIVYNMYRMRRFTPNTVCAGCCLLGPPDYAIHKTYK
jgi:hypothetical protein